MPTRTRITPRLTVACIAIAGSFWFVADLTRGAAAQGGAQTNPDGSLRPSAPVTRLFTQDAYTEYALLEPGSEAFRIRFLPEETRVGATEIVNATRGGSEGTGIEVYDPRTGDPVEFTYNAQPNNPDVHEIRAKLPRPVPEGGIGRVLIYKTYKDARTYMTNGDDIVWVRSLSGYRLGVVLPKGYAFASSNVAAQLSTTDDGRLKLAFANPSGQSNPVTIHAKKTTATFTAAPFADMFFDDIKTLYDLDTPESGRIRVEQTYSDYRKGDHARLDSLAYLKMQDLTVVDLDTAKVLAAGSEDPALQASARAGGGPSLQTRAGLQTGAGLQTRAMRAKLDVPITKDRQSAHLRITGTIADGTYKVANGEIVFDRTLHGLRNTVVLPAGWDVAAVSQSGTIGASRGRAFVALINLNGENSYRVTIRARRR